MDKQPTAVTPIDSEYFAEEDVMAIQATLIEKGCIDTDPDYDHHFELTDPVILAKALDRLVNVLIADIIQDPDEILFSNLNGNQHREFDRAVQYVIAEAKELKK
jgi:hypothetical protein